MFSHANRFPTDPTTNRLGRSVRPWGLSRMDRYLDTVVVPYLPVGLDPVTQTTRYLGPDCTSIVDAKHRATNTGTDKPTQTSQGDRKESGMDQDHDQDSDSD